MNGSLLITAALVRSSRAQTYLEFLLIRGKARGFPDNAVARRMADELRMRMVWLCLFALLSVAAIVLLIAINY